MSEEEEESSVALETTGEFASVKWAVKLKVYGASAAGFAIWGGAWYHFDPPSSFLPLAIGGMVMGFLGGRVISEELVQELRTEIGRRDAEIRRQSAVKARLESRLLAARASSKDNQPRRRKRG